MKRRTPRSGGREPDRSTAIPQVFTPVPHAKEKCVQLAQFSQTERRELEIDDQLSFWETHLGEPAEVV